MPPSVWERIRGGGSGERGRGEREKERKTRVVYTNVGVKVKLANRSGSLSHISDPVVAIVNTTWGSKRGQSLHTLSHTHNCMLPVDNLRKLYLLHSPTSMGIPFHCIYMRDDIEIRPPEC